MKTRRSITTTTHLLLALAYGCETTIIESAGEDIEKRPCDPSFGSSDGSSSDGSSSDGTGDATDAGSSSDDGTSSTGEDPFACPTIVDGDVVFCLPQAGVCRTIYFLNVANATGQGPLLTWWGGTYSSPESDLPWSPLDSDPAWGPRQGLRPMVENTDGVLAMPRADPNAVGRVNNPYPWWPVCDPAYQNDPAHGCDRQDDYELAAMLDACVVEQGLADPDRLSAAGMSAGGIFVSHLLEDPAALDLAAVVSWSGGERSDQQPTVRAGTTATMVLHGGPTDQFCASFLSTGCYDFVQPSVQLAHDTSAVIACNHGDGHSAVMGGQGAEFMSAARLGQAHPWIGFPVGGGNGSWTPPAPSMSDGSAWVLHNDCVPF